MIKNYYMHMFNVVSSILHEIYSISLMMAPYLLVGLFLGGVISQLISSNTIKTYLGSHSRFPALKAALFGVPMPICSCGVLPLSISLKKQGASTSAVLSFMSSTPQTGVDSLMLTYGMLGGLFTLFRGVTAFLSGILCGWTTGLAEKHSATPIIEPSLVVDEKKSIKQLFKHAFITMPQDIAKPIAIGILLSGVTSYWLPDDFFIYTQNSPWLSMLCMAFAGIPIYICSAASVPLALVFLQSGLSPGATLVFLIMGPATNMATLTTLLDQFGKKITLVYILTLLAVALVSGILLHQFSSHITFDEVYRVKTTCAESSIHILSSLALYPVLAWGWIKKMQQGR